MPAVGEAVARLLDNPKAVNRHPAAAKVLGALLEKLHFTAAPARRSNLALVRTMIRKGDTPQASAWPLMSDPRPLWAV
jgi:hypothetical protein